MFITRSHITQSHHHPDLACYLSMIFSENRCTLSGSCSTDLAPMSATRPGVARSPALVRQPRRSQRLGSAYGRTAASRPRLVSELRPSDRAGALHRAVAGFAGRGREPRHPLRGPRPRSARPSFPPADRIPLRGADHPQCDRGRACGLRCLCHRPFPGAGAAGNPRRASISR